MSLTMRRLTSLLTASALVAAMAVATVPAAVSAAAPPAPYFNGFENAGDVGSTDQAMFSVSQVVTGPGAITSADGTYHALAVAGSNAFTRYGGYSSTFPLDGYTTSIDIYLDTAASTPGSDLQFDWTSAISIQPAAIWTSSSTLVQTVGGCDERQQQRRMASEPARDPYTITTAGWYRFSTHSATTRVSRGRHEGLSGATVLAGWTLSDPSDVMKHRWRQPLRLAS
jgi:hypothetical protein